MLNKIPGAQLSTVRFRSSIFALIRRRMNARTAPPESVALTGMPHFIAYATSLAAVAIQVCHARVGFAQNPSVVHSEPPVHAALVLHATAQRPMLVLQVVPDGHPALHGGIEA